MRSIGTAAILALSLLAPMGALADGWIFNKGRFPQGKTTVFTLTTDQKLFLDLIRRCHLDNTKTPYIFHLTASQTSELSKKTGIRATRFQAFDSYNGETGADEGLNIVVRFSRDKFEVPHLGLVTDKEARAYETDIIGWDRNPLEDVNPKLVRPGSCPAPRV